MEDNKKPVIDFKQLTYIIIAAILGAFISLHVFMMYEKNNNQLPEISIDIMAALLALSVNYLVNILLVILIIILIYKYLEKFTSLVDETSARNSKYLKKKFPFFNRKKKRKKKKNKWLPELWNLFILLLPIVVMIHYRQTLLEPLNWWYYIIFVYVVYLIVDRLRIIYTTSKGNHK